MERSIKQVFISAERVNLSDTDNEIRTCRLEDILSALRYRFCDGIGAHKENLFIVEVESAADIAVLIALAVKFEQNSVLLVDAQGEVALQCISEEEVGDSVSLGYLYFSPTKPNEKQYIEITSGYLVAR
ncbi:hypothetical protein [Pasteurella phage vB_PmuP_PHB02]|uniref:Uncharacterized protein n=1 Tax=Pasteurella phage vB_PmuP_PHB02 TaxID=2005054 RepID=A0A1Y0SVQ2_9CAUD|nr:SAM-dependent methyltransferase [Pasteurella phage vB_PmuP_PHB02]ARV77611.1 hypothetical protein [Pasteurella phage vB_PmuP_PHB02]